MSSSQEAQATQDEATQGEAHAESRFYQERSVPGYAGVTLRGILMGGADVIPGVSGGTMALIMGIYRELIASIRAFDIRALRLILTGQLRAFSKHINLPFLVALLLGIGVAIGSLSRLLPKLLYTYPAPTKGLFFGLILASIWHVWRTIDDHGAGTVIMAILGTAGAYYFVGLIPVQTPENMGFIFLCGFIAICAMILPGLSGAFLLLLLGKYSFILESLSHVLHHRKVDHNLLVVFVFILGCICGLLAFSRLLNWLLDRYQSATLAVLTGLMVGSLRKIWPFQKGSGDLETAQSLSDQFFWPFREDILFAIKKKGLFLQNYWPNQWSSQFILAAVLVVVGILFVLTLDYIANKHQAKTS